MHFYFNFTYLQYSLARYCFHYHYTTPFSINLKILGCLSVTYRYRGPAGHDIYICIYLFTLANPKPNIFNLPKPETRPELSIISEPALLKSHYRFKELRILINKKHVLLPTNIFANSYRNSVNRVTKVC